MARRLNKENANLLVYSVGSRYGVAGLAGGQIAEEAKCQMDETKDAELKVLAAVLYELRIVLGAYLASGPGDLQYAAHLAYAVHNNALAVIEGKSFDANKAIDRIEYVEKIVSGEGAERLAAHIRHLLVTGSPPTPNADSN